MANKGTDGYKAPEIYKNRQGFKGEKADMFALGVILFIFEFGIPPFLIANNGDINYRYFCRSPDVKKYFFKMHPATKEYFRMNTLDPDLVDLILCLLDQDPDKRPESIAEIRQFKYL